MTDYENTMFINFLQEAMKNTQNAMELYMKTEQENDEKIIQLSKLQNIGIALIELITHQTTPEMLDDFDESQLSKYLFTIQQLINIRKDMM